MMAITKEFSWSMSHRLEGHKGLCNNVHGHNYKLFITIRRITGCQVMTGNRTGNGMVCDFHNLKDIVNEVIIAPLDHCFAYNRKDKDSVLIATYLIDKINQKVKTFDFRLTAENMVEWIVEMLNKYFEEQQMNLYCVNGTLYETETSSATYSCESDDE